jgi:hypothetical protein
MNPQASRVDMVARKSTSAIVIDPPWTKPQAVIWLAHMSASFSASSFSGSMVVVLPKATG